MKHEFPTQLFPSLRAKVKSTTFFKNRKMWRKRWAWALWTVKSEKRCRAKKAPLAVAIRKSQPPGVGPTPILFVCPDAFFAFFQSLFKKKGATTQSPLQFGGPHHPTSLSAAHVTFFSDNRIH